MVTITKSNKMEHIQEDFISFETAKLLKEKGFNVQTTTLFCALLLFGEAIDKVEDCFLNWNCKEFYHKNTLEANGRNWKESWSRPTQALVVKWLRVKHNIHIQSPTPYIYRNKTNYEVRIFQKPYANSGFESPEQATEAAILYTLKNLI